MANRPLPSWNDGPARAAILDFVARITRLRGSEYLRPAERIAVFDNDGTLWCEQPMQAQVFFLADRVKALAASDPSIATRQPYAAFLAHDVKTLHALGKRGIEELFFATHAGMSEEAFDAIARAWLSCARHPELDRPFTQLAYQPQIELLHYLRDNGFKNFIVSGGGIDLIRAFSEQVYDIPRERVIGSSAKLRSAERDGRVDLMKLAELGSFDDREEKVANIGLHIGRRPLLCFGNSDGDLAMLRYTKSGPGPRLALLLHHDDAKREFVYDRDFKLSPLADALDRAEDYGITLVSMQRDWNSVFTPAESESRSQKRTA